MRKYLGSTGLAYFWGKIKSLLATGLSEKADKATTLSGYGITDAINTSSTAQTKAGNLTAAKFITSGGTSSQVVRGDGSLVDPKLLPQYEAYLEWGGKNFNASYGPIDAAMVSELGAPRTMFAKAAGIVVEYSTDGGNTWLDYGATDVAKIGLFSSGQSFYTGKNSTAGGGSANNMLRVSLLTGAASIYTSLNKFVIYVSTSGSNGCYCTIRCRTQQNYENNVDTWVTKADQVPISGWSGYNVINTTSIVTYGNVKSSHYGELQFIFGCTSFSGNYPGLTVIKIIGFGGVGWVAPSNMAKTGHLYSFNASQDAFFPAQVQATSFKKSGGTSSQFLKADGSVDGTSYGTYSKPSGGIPKTDLASAVQTSLGKADTALQSFTETDPTVPAWAKAANKPSYTPAEIGALPDTTTIPSASTATPQMDGTGAAGSASTYAKGDHVHPSDTSREARVTTASHGTSDTTFALTPNVLHTWGTINSLTLTLASGSSTYVDGYWFKFTAGSSFTALTLPTGVDWVTEPEIEAGKTYEVMIVDGLASYLTDGIGDSVKAKTRIVNHGTSDTTFTLTPNTLHIWGEVASLNLTLQSEANGYVNGYWFRFTCGNTPTVLTLPSSVEWYYENVEFEANHTYEVTIVEGKACYTDYASTTQIATKQWVQNNTKTINGESIIGEGDIVIEGGEGTSEIQLINHGTSDTTLSILPNVFHVWGEVSSLTLTLAAGGSGVVNEYMFQFTSGSTPTVLSFSSNVLWITDSTIEANKTYQVSILNDLVVMGGA